MELFRRSVLSFWVGIALCVNTSGVSFAVDSNIKSFPRWGDSDITIMSGWMPKDIAKLEGELSRDPHEIETDGSPRQLLAFKTIENLLTAESPVHPAHGDKAELIAEWQRKFPTSPVPQIFKAMLLLNFAAANAGRFSPTAVLTPENFPVPSGLNEADEALAAVESSAPRYPYWYALRMKIAIARGKAYDELFTLADQAKTAAPRYLETEIILLDYLIDNLHWQAKSLTGAVGSFAEVDGKIDPIIYAQLCLHVFARQEPQRFYDFLNPNWDVLRTGLREIAARYPSSRTSSQYAAVSCVAGDRAEGTAAFLKMGQRIDQAVWQIPRFYEECRAWALPN